MKEDSLQQLINQIDTEKLTTEAYWEIIGRVEGTEEYETHFIRANQQGLKYFALQLLQAALTVSEAKENPLPDLDEIPLNHPRKGSEGTVWLTHIEAVSDTPEAQMESGFTETWKDKLFKFGCLTALLFSVVALIVGIYTIIRWIL